MRRHPRGRGVEPGADQQGQAAIRGPRQDQGQRPRPEAAGEETRIIVENTYAFGHGGVGDMHDQRVVCRPALGLEDARHGLAVAGIGAQPVDGFGRERDQPAGHEAARRGLDRLVLGRQNACSGLGSHRLSQACL